MQRPRLRPMQSDRPRRAAAPIRRAIDGDTHARNRNGVTYMTREETSAKRQETWDAYYGRPLADRERLEVVARGLVEEKTHGATFSARAWLRLLDSFVRSAA